MNEKFGESGRMVSSLKFHTEKKLKLNLEQAANHYKVSKRTIYNLIDRGFLVTEGEGDNRKVMINPQFKYIKGFGSGVKR